MNEELIPTTRANLQQVLDEERAKKQIPAEIMEKVLLGGDLSKLSPAERVIYYRAVCDSVGLNPLTRPFQYIILNGKLTLYASKDCSEQLRRIHRVSIGKLDKTFKDDLYIVEAPATDKTGRTDSSTGAVNLKGLSGELLANALMKAETKAKRRVTLSICGLGFLDETEVESIPGAVKVPMPPEPPEDVPSVDLRADAKEGGSPTLPLADISPPSAAQSQIPAPPRKDYPFLREMRRQKDRIGPEAYYRVLGGDYGVEHADEIIERPDKVAIFKQLQALPPFVDALAVPVEEEDIFP